MITIIDLGISNIKSIARGFSTQGFEMCVSTDPDVVLHAESLVLPGVGAYPKACEVLKKRGLWDVVIQHGKSGKPLLGVCLGMQLLFTDSEEHGKTVGLGLLRGHVVCFPRDRPVPHMGWNEVVQTRSNPLFQSIEDRANFYFVHSYHVKLEDESSEIGYSDHFGKFSAAVQTNNIFGTQFHPEKSQINGLTVLKNFALLTVKQ